MAEINEAPDCGCDYDPKTYLGMYRCQQNLEPQGFRAQFENRQLDTELAYWEIMTETFEKYYPQVMCDPCMGGPKLSFADALETRYAKPFTLKNEIQITCGQVKHKLRPGDRCGETSTWAEQFRDEVARHSLAQSRGFDLIEDDIASELMITEKVTFEKSEYLPEGLTISYPRHEDLNCETSECFGKGQCNSMGIVENWLQKLECFEESNRVTDVFMHWCTWQDWKASEDMKECLKSYNPQLFLSNQLLNQFNLEPMIRPRGINRVYTDPNGIRYWTVNVQSKEKDAEGNLFKCDMFPKNKMLAFDLSNGECSYRPLMIYTPIMDIIAATEEPAQINAARYAMTDVDRKAKCWNREMTSNLMPVLPYPNSSSSLTLCAPKKATEKKAPAKAGA